MKSDQDILKEFRERKGVYIEEREWWARNEVRDNYRAIEGDSLFFENDELLSGSKVEGSLDKTNSRQLPYININRLASITDSICGFQVQNRTEADFMPRLSNEQSENFEDIMDKGADYIREDTMLDNENSRAFYDMLVCGEGCTETVVSYDENPDGEPEVRRIFPYFTMKDTASRKPNYRDANWVAHAELKNRDMLRLELEADYGKEAKDISFGSSDEDAFFDYMDYTGEREKLVLDYIYQWREKVPFYRIENPLRSFTFIDAIDPQIKQLMQALSQKYSFDPQNDRIFTVMEEVEFSGIRAAFEQLGVGIKHSKQRTYRYYRARIIGDTVVSKSENYSQRGFSLKFMTGKWSETRRCYYGVIRAAKQPQRLLDGAINDLYEFLRTTPLGGVMIEEDAVLDDDPKQFIKTYSKAKHVTVFKKGALTGGKVQPKPTIPTPPALVDMITFANQAILEVFGITKEWMGQADGSANQAAMLQSQRVRQALMVLAPYFDSMKYYTLNQAGLFPDLLRVMAENNEGRLIRHVTGSSSREYIRLVSDRIAKEYDVFAKESAKTPDEQEKMMASLLDVAGMLNESGRNGGALLPMILDNMDLTQDKIEEIMQRSEPAPVEPDPVNQALIQSQIALNETQAALNDARAKTQGVEGLKGVKDLATYEEKKERELRKTDAEIEETETTSDWNAARTVSELRQPSEA